MLSFSKSPGRMFGYVFQEFYLSILRNSSCFLSKDWRNYSSEAGNSEPIELLFNFVPHGK